MGGAWVDDQRAQVVIGATGSCYRGCPDGPHQMVALDGRQFFCSDQAYAVSSSHSGIVAAENSVPSEISTATIRPSPPMRMAST
ncbi:hypothetical protein LMG5911_01324 [Achromobacter spanius]|nr:hypothetical protein LMG5911_01324 [Achromobacter spanius]